ncbi:hypothetical protein E3O45_15120 [Cryobacterium sp. TMS1-20-1]|uniref:hypothetical protein n=1 Tax=Cryobacterium sp. TMS1-20-1 TaxID=1259223 RepID=UPI00106B430F|nr:hypothetical protein [Cryobacterium sp. TMS1-20-1]TFC71402.1 hypothetical protein E3O45_15120 [Cryobacterium sp. TMS1-20-1]
MSADPRFVREGKSRLAWLQGQYGRAIAALNVKDHEAAAPFRDYVRALRGECAAMRVQAVNDRQRIAYLKGRLDALEGIAR